MKQEIANTQRGTKLILIPTQLTNNISRIQEIIQCHYKVSLNPMES